jgi:hypothetical protein
MSDEKKLLSRRSFFRNGAAVGVVAAASGGGLLVKPLEAQGGKGLKRGSVKEPPGVKEDKDLGPLADKLLKAGFEGAYDAFNAAFESLVKGKEKTMNAAALLSRQGIKLKSPEAKAAAKSHKVPASILKVREEKSKQKGWHAHAMCYGCGCWVHAHVSW